MSPRRDDESDELSRDSEQFVREIEAGYAPDPPTAARAQAFDAALEKRLDEPVRQPLWKPALATALVTAAIGWLLLPPAPPPGEETSGVEIVATESPAQSVALAALTAIVEDDAALEDIAWQSDLLTATEVLDLDDGADDEFLPDEYLAIDGVLLGG